MIQVSNLHHQLKRRTKEKAMNRKISMNTIVRVTPTETSMGILYDRLLPMPETITAMVYADIKSKTCEDGFYTGTMGSVADLFGSHIDEIVIIGDAKEVEELDHEKTYPDFVCLEYNLKGNYFHTSSKVRNSPVYPEWKLVTEQISLKDSGEYINYCLDHAISGTDVIDHFPRWRYWRRQ